MRVMTYVTWLGAAVFVLLAPPAAGQTRSPFDEPEKSVNRYDYPAALTLCRVTGIITTGTGGRVILEIAGYDRPGVYAEKDRIFIRYNGVTHEFILERILRKGMKLKAKDNQTHEVELR
jgi:hypothetical protein